MNKMQYAIEILFIEKANCLSSLHRIEHCVVHPEYDNGYLRNDFVDKLNVIDNAIEILQEAQTMGASRKLEKPKEEK